MQKGSNYAMGQKTSTFPGVLEDSMRDDTKHG